MTFIVQTENNNKDLDSIIFEESLKEHKYGIDKPVVLYSSLEELKNTDNPLYKKSIPIGSIEFVTTWAKKYHNITQINPIEIPPILRTEEFLKREYKIVHAKDLPKHGTYFIKDASELKKFSYLGEMSLFLTPDIFDKPDNPDDCSLYLDPNHLYVVSEPVKILSEYRVYIFNGVIENIVNYDGDPLIFPDPKIINKANLMYSSRPDCPKSYTMDIMVTPKGTAIIEIHDFFSCGLYGSLWGANLAYAYKDGIDWLLKHNSETKPS